MNPENPRKLISLEEKEEEKPSFSNMYQKFWLLIFLILVDRFVKVSMIWTDDEVGS